MRKIGGERERKREEGQIKLCENPKWRVRESERKREWLTDVHRMFRFKMGRFAQVSLT